MLPLNSQCSRRENNRSQGTVVVGDAGYPMLRWLVLCGFQLGRRNEENSEEPTWSLLCDLQLYRPSSVVIKCGWLGDITIMFEVLLKFLAVVSDRWLISLICSKRYANCAVQNSCCIFLFSLLYKWLIRLSMTVREGSVDDWLRKTPCNPVSVKMLMGLSFSQSSVHLSLSLRHIFSKIRWFTFTLHVH